jgi:branched-chain amino acid transport system ATP-binding protein
MKKMKLLETKGLTKRFGGLTAVDNLDIVVDKGEIVGLVGPNGAGKTTAFNIITGVMPPTSGSVIFKGKDVTGLKPYEIAKEGLVRTFQLTTVFGEATVLENVIAGSYLSARQGFWQGLFNMRSARNQNREVLQKAMGLLEFMGLAELKDVKANGLPHGHQRILGVAMAMAANPELILLDEPVTGMTPSETKIMMSKLEQIWGEGMGILLVEHNMKAVMGICKRIYVISFGKKIAEGSPEEIIKNKQVVEAYLGVRHAA